MTDKAPDAPGVANEGQRRQPSGLLSRLAVELTGCSACIAIVIWHSEQGTLIDIGGSSTDAPGSEMNTKLAQRLHVAIKEAIHAHVAEEGKHVTDIITDERMAKA